MLPSAACHLQQGSSKWLGILRCWLDCRHDLCAHSVRVREVTWHWGQLDGSMFGLSCLLYGSIRPQVHCKHLPWHLHQDHDKQIIIPTSDDLCSSWLPHSSCSVSGKPLREHPLDSQTICVAFVVWKISVTAWPPSSWSLLSKMLSPDAGQDVDRWQASLVLVNCTVFHMSTSMDHFCKEGLISDRWRDYMKFSRFEYGFSHQSVNACCIFIAGAP